MQEKTARLLIAGGLVAPVLWLAAFLYSGSLRPDYSHARQYVSELAARGTPTQRVMQVTGFVIPGLLTAGFGLFMGRTVRARRAGVAASLVIVSGLARAAAGVFPADPCCSSAPPSVDQQIHNVAGGVFYVTLLLAALMWSFSARQVLGPRSGWFRWYSLASAVLAVVLPPMLIGAGVATAGDVGLFQRASFGVLNLWMLLFAAAIWSRPVERA